MSFILNKIMTWVVGRIVASFNSLFKVMKHLLLATPTVTHLPQVQALTARTTAVLDVVFVVVFLAAAILIMVSGGSERARYTVKDLMPRIVVAFIAAHFSPLLCTKAIGLTNSLAAALTIGGGGGKGAFTAIRAELSAGPNHIAILLFAVAATLLVVLYAALVFAWLGRLGLLIVLAVVAPLALACHALPQTDPAARMWWRAFAGCLAIPLLQAMTLQAGEVVLLDPAAMGSLTHTGISATLSLLASVAMLWITVKIPAMVRQSVMRSRGSNPVAGFVRVVVVQQGIRLITRGTAGRPRAAGGAAGRRARAGFR